MIGPGPTGWGARLGIGGLLVVFTAISLLPIGWAFLTSLKQPVDAFALPPVFFFTPTLEFHRQIWIERGFLRFLRNSLVIATAVVLVSVPIGTLAGYALSRIQTRRTRGLLFGLLAVRAFPHILLAIPFFVLAKGLGLYDTYTVVVLALVAVNQPFTIWLMRGFFLDVPIELDEAARIDGCGDWAVFWRIVLPCVRPGVAVAGLFSLLLAYNEFLFPLVLTSTARKPLTVAISEYSGEDLYYWSLSAAGAIGITLPIIVIMVFAQRHFVRGLTSGAIKG